MQCDIIAVIIKEKSMYFVLDLIFFPVLYCCTRNVYQTAFQYKIMLKILDTNPGWNGGWISSHMGSRPQACGLEFACSHHVRLDFIFGPNIFVISVCVPCEGLASCPVGLGLSFVLHNRIQPPCSLVLGKWFWWMGEWMSRYPLCLDLFEICIFQFLDL